MGDTVNYTICENITGSSECESVEGNKCDWSENNCVATDEAACAGATIVGVSETAARANCTEAGACTYFPQAQQHVSACLGTYSLASYQAAHRQSLTASSYGDPFIVPMFDIKKESE